MRSKCNPNFLRSCKAARLPTAAYEKHFYKPKVCSHEISALAGLLQLLTISSQLLFCQFHLAGTITEASVPSKAKDWFDSWVRTKFYVYAPGSILLCLANPFTEDACLSKSTISRREKPVSPDFGPLRVYRWKTASAIAPKYHFIA